MRGNGENQYDVLVITWFKEGGSVLEVMKELVVLCVSSPLTLHSCAMIGPTLLGWASSLYISRQQCQKGPDLAIAHAPVGVSALCPQIVVDNKGLSLDRRMMRGAEGAILKQTNAKPS